MLSNYRLLSGVCWGIIPARGGSKSIPYKNIAELAGRPLVDYNIIAAQKSNSISRIVCSTDSEKIANHCKSLDVEISIRPNELSTDNANVKDLIVYLIKEYAQEESVIPEYIALLQPTSPFLLPEHIDRCCEELKLNHDYSSAQTIVACPHNHHAYNQRIIEDGKLEFRFKQEREVAYNKQTKPSHYVFGNLIVMKSESVLKENSIFPEPSLGVEIDSPYDFDADNKYDFKIAELMLSNNLVKLGHL